VAQSRYIGLSAASLQRAKTTYDPWRSAIETVRVADGNAITSNDLVDELTASYRSVRAHAAISGSRAGDRAPDDCRSI